MNGNELDTQYRYTMPAFKVQIAGKGNGIYTIFNNMDDICKKLNHPPEVIFRYIAFVTGSSYTEDRNMLTGSHTPEKLKEIILHYIRHSIMCSSCVIPETIPEIIGSKKNLKINLRCSACKHVSPFNVTPKYMSKAEEIIIKHIQSGKPWPQNKGTMVLQKESRHEIETEQVYDSVERSEIVDETDGTQQTNEINPFDII